MLEPTLKRARRGTFVVATVLAAWVVLGCDSYPSAGVGGGGSGGSTALIRLVNATATSLDLVVNGNVASGNGTLPYASASSCVSVVASSPNASVRATGTTTTLHTFTGLTAGGSYLLIAYPASIAAGAPTQLAQISGSPSLVTGQAAVRGFNAAPGAGALDLYVTPSATPLTTPTASAIAFGAASSYTTVPSGSAREIRFNSSGATTPVIDAGGYTFTSGERAVIIAAPPATGTTAYRAFLVHGC